MKYTSLAFLLLLVMSFRMDRTAEEGFRLPGDWEPQEALWVGVFYGQGRDQVSASIIKSIYREIPVRLNYAVDSLKYRFNRLLHSRQVDTTRLQWIKDSIGFNWVRDVGPLFLVNDRGEQKVACFGWNDYGNCFVENKPLRRADSVIGRIGSRMAGRLGLPVISTDMVAEGGGLETNGAGVLMSIEETALQRNPGKSLEEIEKEYLRVTGCKKMIWLKRMTIQEKSVTGLSARNWVTVGANGHIDEVVRFLSPTTVAVARIDEAQRRSNPISRADYEIIEEYLSALKKATDLDGRPFNIVRIPSPDLNVLSSYYRMDKEMRKSFTGDISHIKDGDTVRYIPAVSYMNFMSTNKTVLIAKYWQEGMPVKERDKDERVRRIFEQVYPGRRIVQINPYPINGGGGGIHCATLAQPKRKP